MLLLPWGHTGSCPDLWPVGLPPAALGLTLTYTMYGKYIMLIRIIPKQTIKTNQYKKGCFLEKEGSIDVIYVIIKTLTVKPVNEIYKYKLQLYITTQN